MRQITKQIQGTLSVHETRETLAALERLGFRLDSIDVYGTWLMNGQAVALASNQVPAPKIKFELAPNCWIAPTALSTVVVTASIDESELDV